MLEPYDWKGNADLLNIVMIGVTNYLPENDESFGVWNIEFDEGFRERTITNFWRIGELFYYDF